MGKRDQKEKSKDNKRTDKTFSNNQQSGTLTPEQQRMSSEELFNEARGLYQIGAAGDVKAARQALGILEYLYKEVPGNALYQAYYASAYILKAREETNLVEKGKISSMGLNILDRALSKEPDNIEIRIVHAYVCKNLPEWLNRGSTAIEDFQYLRSRYEADPSVFSEEFYHHIQSEIEEVQKKIRAIKPHVQKIYDSFSEMAKKKMANRK